MQYVLPIRISAARAFRATASPRVTARAAVNSAGLAGRRAGGRAGGRRRHLLPTRPQMSITSSPSQEFAGEGDAKMSVFIVASSSIY